LHELATDRRTGKQKDKVTSHDKHNLLEKIFYLFTKYNDLVLYKSTLNLFIHLFVHFK